MEMRRMNVEMAIAGLACFVLAFGHVGIGAHWVLPISPRKACRYAVWPVHDYA